MSLRFKPLRILQLVATIVGAVLLHRADAAAPVKVCVDNTNPSSDLDERVARAALASQGFDVENVYFEGHGKQADDGFPIAKFAKLAQNECALIMGFPVDVGSAHLPPNVSATSAYASTGFVLVQRSGGAKKSIETLAKGTEVGIAQLDTWAGLLFTQHSNIVMHVYPDDDDMLAELQAGKIGAGLTWQSYLHAYEKKHANAKLSAHVLSGPHMVWDLVALYAASSQSTADAFGKGLAMLSADGKLDAIVRPYQSAVALEKSPTAHVSRRAHRIDVANRCDKPAKAAKAPAKPPALYTEEQATQGAINYYQNCAMCHGPLLDGQRGGYPGPALKGAAFADPSYDFHVDEIFRFVAKLMPAPKPGSLTDEQNVTIMAFMLKQNGYPAGATPLTYDGAMKSRVPIRYYGK
jgi:polar amino acid transport system substrate-binding protein